MAELNNREDINSGHYNYKVLNIANPSQGLLNLLLNSFLFLQSKKRKKK